MDDGTYYLTSFKELPKSSNHSAIQQKFYKISGIYLLFLKYQLLSMIYNVEYRLLIIWF